MTGKEMRRFTLGLPEATEDHPFGDVPDVFRVAGRIFAFRSPEFDPVRISLKCDPEMALLLREKYAAVTPGFHLNKKHWNTVVLDGSIPDDEIEEMIEHSYDCVVAKLRKADRERLLAYAAAQRIQAQRDLRRLPVG